MATFLSAKEVIGYQSYPIMGDYIPMGHDYNLEENAWRDSGVLCLRFGGQLTPKKWSPETTQVVFNKQCKDQLKLNLLKYVHLEPCQANSYICSLPSSYWSWSANVKAIIELPPPINIRELKRSQGLLTYIRRFISNFSRSCHPSLGS